MLPLGLFPWILAGWGKGSPLPRLSFCNLCVTRACLLGVFILLQVSLNYWNLFSVPFGRLPGKLYSGHRK